MTFEHVIFIPAMLLMGFIAGVSLTMGLVRRAQRNIQSANVTSAMAKQSLSSKSKSWPLMAALLLFFLVFVLTHILPTPNGVVHVKQLTEGVSLFDQSPLFDTVAVYQRIDNYGVLARDAYQTFLWSTDLVFPLSMLLLLLIYGRFVANKHANSLMVARILLALPSMWFFLDMIENSMIFVLIEQFPRPTALVAPALAYVTLAKFVMLLLAFLAPSGLLLKSLLSVRKLA